MFGFGAFGQLAFGEAPAAVGYQLDISAASYTLTLQSANLKYGRSLSLSAANIALTFPTTALSLTMPFAVGSFTASLVTTGTRAARIIAWSPTPTPKRSHFGFAAFGQQAFGGSSLLSATTTFSLSLGSVFLRQGKAVQISAAAYTITWQGTTLSFQRAIAPAAAAYQLTFIATPLRITMPFAAASYTLSMQTFDYTRSSIKLRRFPRIGATPRVRSTGGGVKARAYGG